MTNMHGYDIMNNACTEVLEIPCAEGLAREVYLVKMIWG